MHIDDEITARIAKASVVFWKNPRKCSGAKWNKIGNKQKVYKVVVVPLTYICETWTEINTNFMRILKAC